jgi:hypothetical protein
MSEASAAAVRAVVKVAAGLGVTSDEPAVLAGAVAPPLVNGTGR